MAEICRQLQDWMLAQITDDATGLDQLVGGRRQDLARLNRRDRWRWRGLWPPADCVNIAQATFVTRENHERAVLRELLSTMDLEGVLIQADALHTRKPFFGSSWSKGPTSS
jgi:hypothetical protein